MSEEIKEILDRLENYDNYKYRNDNGLSYKEIEGWEIDLLLDYITNLQEKVDQYENPEDYTLFYMWLDEKAKDKMKKLQEENEYSNHCNEELRKKITNLEYKIERLQEENTKLKELCDKYEEEHKTTFEEWKKDIKANKKAIEYINKHCVNEKVSKEVGYKCYTMADTNELEYIMKKLGDDYE